MEIMMYRIQMEMSPVSTLTNLAFCGRVITSPTPKRRTNTLETRVIDGIETDGPILLDFLIPMKDSIIF